VLRSHKAADRGRIHGEDGKLAWRGKGEEGARLHIRAAHWMMRRWLGLDAVERCWTGSWSQSLQIYDRGLELGL